VDAVRGLLRFGGEGEREREGERGRGRERGERERECVCVCVDWKEVNGRWEASGE
jgi:hypothetical protein